MEGEGGYLDAVGDVDKTGVDSRGVDWGPSVGNWQTRTLRYPTQYATYDRVRDIGTLAGRAPGTEQAPDAVTAEAAALAQAKAVWVLHKERGWTWWSVYNSGAYLPHVGKDYPLRLGHAQSARWRLSGQPA